MRFCSLLPVRLVVFAAISLSFTGSALRAVIDPDIILRADSNQDGAIDIADVTHLNNWLFNGGPEPDCLNQADANNDGVVNLSDSSYIVNFLYNNGPNPPAPGTRGLRGRRLPVARLRLPGGVRRLIRIPGESAPGRHRAQFAAGVRRIATPPR